MHRTEISIAAAPAAGGPRYPVKTAARAGGGEGAPGGERGPWQYREVPGWGIWGLRGVAR